MPQSCFNRIGATEFYIFKYENAIFFLLSGQTIIYSGWNVQIQQNLEKFINQVNNQIQNVTFTDHTYFQVQSSRRLRSLGGGLRRILYLIKMDNSFLTNKKIIKNLQYFVILGNEEKLVTQIFAVEKNAKFTYQTESKNIDLPLDQYLNLVKSLIFEQLSNNQRIDTINLIENFQKDIKKKLDKSKQTFCC